VYGILVGSENYQGQTDNEITNNTFYGNHNDIKDYGSDNTYENNKFYYSPSGNMISVTEGERELSKGGTATLEYTLKNIDGSDCPECYVVPQSSPEEHLTITPSDTNIFTVSFTPHQGGVYSVQLAAEDTSFNNAYKNVIFFVGDMVSYQEDFYLDVNDPSYGQSALAGRADLGSLTKDAPANSDPMNCGAWVQASPDDIPDYPLGILDQVDFEGWYKYRISNEAPYVGIQRYINVDWNVDDPGGQFSFDTNDYHWISSAIEDINWQMSEI